MTQEETYRVLGILKKGWPAYYRQMDRKEAEGVAELWNAMLVDYPVEIVVLAVERFLAQDTKGYPPSIGQVIAGINAIQRPPTEQMTEAEAWSKVKSAMANGAYHSAEEYAKLPPVLQKVIGSHERLHDWALLEEDMVENSIRPMICRSYTVQAEREKEQLALPPSMAKQLAGLAERKALPAEPQKQAIQPPSEPQKQVESPAMKRFFEAVRALAQQKEEPQHDDDIRQHDAEARARLEAQYAALKAGGVR